MKNKLKDKIILKQVYRALLKKGIVPEKENDGNFDKLLEDGYIKIEKQQNQKNPATN